MRRERTDISTAYTQDWDWSANGAWSIIRKTKLSRHGTVHTPHGSVEVEIYDEVTYLSTVARGRLWYRQIDRPFSDRYAKTLARRFAREIEAKR